MTTVLDIITDAMQESGILTQTESPSSSEAQKGLRLLNRLVSSWSNSALMQFERVTESFTLSNGTESYTIGSGGVLNTTRPTKIVEAHIRNGDIDYSMEIVTDKTYQRVTSKTSGGIPEILNYTNEYPLGTINLYPSPSAGYTLFITSEKPLTSYASTATTVSLPDGWEDALTYNLAVRMARVYGQPLDPELQGLARQTKAMVTLNVLRNNPLEWGNTSTGLNNNIYSGYGS